MCSSVQTSSKTLSFSFLNSKELENKGADYEAALVELGRTQIDLVCSGGLCKKIDRPKPLLAAAEDELSTSSSLLAKFPGLMGEDAWNAGVTEVA